MFSGAGNIMVCLEFVSNPFMTPEKGQETLKGRNFKSFYSNELGIESYVFEGENHYGEIFIYVRPFLRLLQFSINP